jgi:hypothetical protein
MRRFLQLVLMAMMIALLTASPVLAHGVPNEKNWHIHDGLGAGPGAGDHHAGLVFFPALFLQEGLIYGTAEAPYVWCTNSADKGLLAPGGQGTVGSAGHCVNDLFILHLLRGAGAPAGWSTLALPGDDLYYRLTPIG